MSSVFLLMESFFAASRGVSSPCSSILEAALCEIYESSQGFGRQTNPFSVARASGIVTTITRPRRLSI